MEFQDIRAIVEIPTGADFNESHTVIQEVNIYLRFDWILLGVHERGWHQETGRSTTVYILGHRNTNPLYFKREDFLGDWKGYYKEPTTVIVPDIPF